MVMNALHCHISCCICGAEMERESAVLTVSRNQGDLGLEAGVEGR